jgi:hypothetical protein
VTLAPRARVPAQDLPWCVEGQSSVQRRLTVPILSGANGLPPGSGLGACPLLIRPPAQECAVPKAGSVTSRFALDRSGRWSVPMLWYSEIAAYMGAP